MGAIWGEILILEKVCGKLFEKASFFSLFSEFQLWVISLMWPILFSAKKKIFYWEKIYIFSDKKPAKFIWDLSKKIFLLEAIVN